MQFTSSRFARMMRHVFAGDEYKDFQGCQFLLTLVPQLPLPFFKIHCNIKIDNKPIKVFPYKTERKECHVFSVCLQLFRINMLLACVSPHSIGMAHALECPGSKSRHRAVMSSVFESISSIYSATLPLRNQWICLTNCKYILVRNTYT